MGAIVPIDVAESLMGHEGYLTEIYRRYSPEDLAKFYKQGEPALLIFTEAEEVNGLTAENTDLKQRTAKLEAEISALKEGFSELLDRLEKGLVEDLGSLEKDIIPVRDVERAKSILKKEGLLKEK